MHGRVSLRRGALRGERRPDAGDRLHCSICTKHGLLLTFTPADRFKLVSGQDRVKDYQFNKHMIHHQFCPTCGVESFARGNNPDGSEMIAINVRCLDGVDLSALKPKPFDGKSL